MTNTYKSFTINNDSNDIQRLITMVNKMNSKIDVISDNLLDLQEEVEKVNKKIDRNDNELNDKMEEIQNNIENINKDFDKIKDGKIFINNSNYKELNDKTYQDIIKSLGQDYILKKLSLRNYQSILAIMEQYFKSDNSTENAKVNYPVKCKGKVDFEYYTDGKWIDDRYGTNVIDLIFKNFQELFLNVNLFPNNVQLNAMIENQQFINKLNHPNYKKEFKKKLRNELLKYN